MNLNAKFLNSRISVGSLSFLSKYDSPLPPRLLDFSVRKNRQKMFLFEYCVNSDHFCKSHGQDLSLIVYKGIHLWGGE